MCMHVPTAFALTLFVSLLCRFFVSSFFYLSPVQLLFCAWVVSLAGVAGAALAGFGPGASNIAIVPALALP